MGTICNANMVNMNVNVQKGAKNNMNAIVMFLDLVMQQGKKVKGVEF
jgi:hypothetical protein